MAVSQVMIDTFRDIYASYTKAQTEHAKHDILITLRIFEHEPGHAAYVEKLHAELDAANDRLRKLDHMSTCPRCHGTGRI